MATIESTITRTLYQTGLAFDIDEGTTSLINVCIDGKSIYTGPVPGVSSSYSANNFEKELLQILFKWPVDINFMGTVIMSIEVIDCTLMLALTQANYIDPTDNASIHSLDYYQEIDGVPCQDPFTNVRIDGVPIYRGISPLSRAWDSAPLTGQWAWEIGPGSIFEATLNIEPSRL